MSPMDFFSREIFIKWQLWHDGLKNKNKWLSINTSILQKGGVCPSSAMSHSYTHFIPYLSLANKNSLSNNFWLMQVAPLTEFYF